MVWLWTSRRRRRRLQGSTCLSLSRLNNSNNASLLSAATFAPGVNSPIITGLFPVVGTAVGDLNGDGIPDLVVNRSNLTAQVFIGTATGAFDLSNIYPSGGPSIALGDFNGDGNLDLATANGVLPGDGAGDFGAVVPGFTLPANAVNIYAEPLTQSGTTSTWSSPPSSMGQGPAPTQIHPSDWPSCSAMGTAPSSRRS